MSEEIQATEEAPAAAPAKKGGKLPIIIALIVVLVGGGFFGMKKIKGGKAAEKPKIELGAIVPTKEFLCNLQEPNTYIKTEIAFRLKKGYDAKQFEELEPAVRDTVNMILSSKSQRDLSTEQGKTLLKRQIAAAVNKVLNSEHEEKKAEPQDKEAAPEKAPEIPEEWDAAEGPILQVFFTNFATQ